MKKKTHLGSDIGNLEVYVINYNNILATSTSIFTLNGTQVQKWIPKHIFLSKDDINYDFIIGVDAVLGTSYQGNLIDSILTCIKIDPKSLFFIFI